MTARESDPFPWLDPEPRAIRGIVNGLAISALCWGAFVVLPLWLHFSKGWGR